MNPDSSALQDGIQYPERGDVFLFAADEHRIKIDAIKERWSRKLGWQEHLEPGLRGLWLDHRSTVRDLDLRRAYVAERTFEAEPCDPSLPEDPGAKAVTVDFGQNRHGRAVGRGMIDLEPKRERETPVVNVEKRVCVRKPRTIW